MKPDARQEPELFGRPNGLYLIAVRVDGRRSHVEHFTEFEPMLEAGKQWLWNDEVAWVSLNVAGGKSYGPEQTHILARKGDAIIIKEQGGRLDRVRRGRERSSQRISDHA